ncbi:MAG: MFS transporter [Acetobacterales bacterium]
MSHVSRHPASFLFMNLGHAYCHLFMLIFPTAVLAMTVDFTGDYSDLLPLSVWGFVAFGAGALPAGWLGDRWSREGMMALFFLGMGTAAVLTSFATTPIALATGLFLIGLFASIYHPVGIALVADRARSTGKALGLNGVFGNLGVALAAALTGVLADRYGWRAAFWAPGVASMLTGLVYLMFGCGNAPEEPETTPQADTEAAQLRLDQRRVFAVLIATTLFGGVIFHATTIGLPKIMDDRLPALAASTAEVGLYVSAVFAVAAVAQIVVGHLLDRYPLRPVFLAVAGLQVPVMLLAASAGNATMLLLATAMMLLVFGQIPISDTIVARYAARAWRSRVYAVKYLLSLGVSASVVPMLAWIRGETGGFLALFLMMALCAALVTTAAAALPRAGKTPQLA